MSVSPELVDTGEVGEGKGGGGPSATGRSATGIGAGAGTSCSEVLLALALSMTLSLLLRMGSTGAVVNGGNVLLRGSRIGVGAGSDSGGLFETASCGTGGGGGVALRLEFPA